MKRFARVLAFAAVFSVLGCMFLPSPPFDIKPETPNLNISPAQVKPLKVAVVIQDPMAYTLFYRGQGGKYTRDMTAECRDRGLLLERDLSKIASDTFSQVFKEVVILRDLPQPGQYDAVINLSIGQILMQEVVVVTGETTELTADWSMSVLDSQNREILNRNGTSPAHNFKWSILNPSHDFIIGISQTMTLALNELAKQWGNTLCRHDGPGCRLRRHG
ncbi:MAG: hypothetical protein PHY31_06165, partial [Smithellaceae bacterium]|nr:hypothetical protein [Smithellaceae bacterium]